MDSLRAACRRFAAWYREQALALWAERAWDDAQGGFHETLDFDGAPGGAPVRRVRVQSRQIYVFAEAARLGWHAGAEELARMGFDYLLDKACPDEGARGCVHLLSRDGAVVDARRDLYDQAFLLLACAAIHRGCADGRALDLAARVAGFLDGELARPSGGYAEDDAGSTPRRQNPHMHLFEAFLALHEATGERGWIERARALRDLFERRFLDREGGRLAEFFAEDWRIAEGEAGRVVEPGHMAEWVVLLEAYGARAKETMTGTQRLLLTRARDLGADAAGFLVDRVVLAEDGGRGASDGARRLWPQTEYLRACLVLARKKDAEAARRAEALIGALFSTYLDTKLAGLWIDRFDGEGRAIAPDAPASILYHLHNAAHDAFSFAAAP